MAIKNLGKVVPQKGVDYFTEEDIKGIVDSGSNDNGTWIKFADGTMIQYGYKIMQNINIETVWGNVYESKVQYDFGEFAQPFLEAPLLFVTQFSGSTMYPETFSGTTTTTKLGQTWFWSPVVRASKTFEFYYLAIGKWK